jgi:hypothetical protein
MPVRAGSVRAFCEHDLDAVVRRESETPVYAGASEVGGTGLEPVTSSLSSWCSPNWVVAKGGGDLHGADCVGRRFRELEPAPAALGVQLVDGQLGSPQHRLHVRPLEISSMPMRMVPPSPTRRPHPDATSAPRPMPWIAARTDRVLGMARDRVCDLMTPRVGWHFEDEVPDWRET